MQREHRTSLLSCGCPTSRRALLAEKLCALEMDAPNHSACLVLAGFCFLLGFASQLLRALVERSEAAWGGGRELDDTLVVPRHTRSACKWPPPRRLSDTPAAAHAPLTPRSEDRSALSQLRAAGEAAWGGGPMPAALDDEVYIAALLEKQRRDHAADVTYARRKLVAAVRWRSEAAAAAAAASSSFSSVFFFFLSKFSFFRRTAIAEYIIQREFYYKDRFFRHNISAKRNVGSSVYT